jgi:hypothetical protein
VTQGTVDLSDGGRGRGFELTSAYHLSGLPNLARSRAFTMGRLRPYSEEGCNERSRNSCHYRRCAHSWQYSLDHEQSLQKRLSRLVRPNFHRAASY